MFGMLLPQSLPHLKWDVILHQFRKEYPALQEPDVVLSSLEPLMELL